MRMRVAIGLVAWLAAATLCGEAAAQQTGEIASGVNQTGVTANAKAIRQADRQLAKQVRHVLAKTKGLVSVNLTVRAKRGVVTLRGSVPDNKQVALAGQVAGGVNGVQSVDNQLTPFRQAQ